MRKRKGPLEEKEGGNLVTSRSLREGTEITDGGGRDSMKGGGCRTCRVE